MKRAVQPVDRLLRAARRRAAIDAGLRGAGHGAAVGLVAATGLLLWARLAPSTLPAWIPAAVVAATAVGGAARGLLRLPRRLMLATTLDRALMLEDRLATVTALDQGARADASFAELVRDDCSRRVAGLRAASALPLRAGSAWLGAGSALLALTLCAWLVPQRAFRGAESPSTPPLTPEQVVARTAAVEEILAAVSEVRTAESQQRATAQPSPAVQARLQELERLAAQLDPAAASPPESEATNSTERAAAILEEIADLREAEALDEAAQADEEARRLAALGDSAQPPGIGEASQFAQALRDGRFDDAARAVEEIERAAGELSPSEREALARYFRELAAQAEANGGDPSTPTGKPVDAAEERTPAADTAARSNPKSQSQPNAQPDPTSGFEPPPPPTAAPDAAPQPRSPASAPRESEAAGPTSPPTSPPLSPPPSPATQPPRPPAQPTNAADRPHADAAERASGSPSERPAGQASQDSGEPAPPAAQAPTAPRRTEQDASATQTEQRPEAPADRRLASAPEASRPTAGRDGSSEAQPSSESPSRSGTQRPSPGDETPPRRSADSTSTISEALRRTAERMESPGAKPQGIPQGPPDGQPAQAVQDTAGRAPDSAEASPAPRTTPGPGAAEALRQLAQRRGQSPSSDPGAEALRQRAERLASADPAEREQLDRWRRAMAREQGAGPGGGLDGRPPEGADARSGADRSEDPARERGGASLGSATGSGTDSPPGTGRGRAPASGIGADQIGAGREDLDLRGEAGKGSDQEIIAEWFDDLPAGEGAGAPVERRTERVQSARRAAERAIERRDVPTRYHDLVRRYFGRFGDAAERADAPRPPSIPPASGSTGSR